MDTVSSPLRVYAVTARNLQKERVTCHAENICRRHVMSQQSEFHATRLATIVSVRTRTSDLRSKTEER